MPQIRERRWRRILSIYGFALIVAIGLVVIDRHGWLTAERASVIAAFLSVIAGAAAWEATGRASDSAEEARKTADIVARIESDRWHHEITPQIDITIHEGGLGTGKAHMHVAFNGPAVHQRIERMLLAVIDDGRERRPGVTYGLSQEQIDAQVWGPYQFESTNDGASDDGRRVPGFAIGLGQQRDFWLIQTAPPGDYPPGNWSVEYGDGPVRIRVECHVAGEPRPWVYIREVQPLMQPPFPSQS